MAVSTRVIKSRIKSIRSTRKITKAMELVAASKMRKAVAAALGSRTYAQLGWELLTHLSAGRISRKHPLLAHRPPRRVLLLVITSNRGLAGGLNANIIRKVVEQLKNPALKEVTLVTIGKKGERALARLGKPILASFHTIADKPSIIDAGPISRLVIEEYAAKKFDQVIIAYTDFISAILQKPKLRQILPIRTADIDAQLQELSADAGETPKASAKFEGFGRGADYLFEPSPDIVLEMMINRLVEVQIYQALLESTASEHSSRMLAMRNASDAAGEMIDDLTFSFNQARQAGITREISEISAGKAALE
ncbi:MAG: ATP synthase F1 subunit gamma, F-type H+-transporting ATPase subunit gamma [Candidatus Magasanikbacteria bacterium]|nr:ATP synthase F1 subunit gamma, F-type H+-transporting ATPase subunit gamma [Candidatus Magasanikbacteria bacterium]